MDTGLWVEILISVFAVFGVCSLIKLLARTFTASDKYAVAIICDRAADPDEIGCLVNRARTAWHTRGPTIVLVRGGAVLPQELERALRDCGVRIFCISEYPGETYEEISKSADIS